MYSMEILILWKQQHKSHDEENMAVHCELAREAIAILTLNGKKIKG